MENIIIISILTMVIGTSLFYLIKEKRKGNKCIGCPNSGCGKCKCNLAKQIQK